MTIKEFKMQLALGALSDTDKEKLAEASTTSREILTILSDDNGDSKMYGWQIRCAVAENPNTPPKVLKKLADPDHPNWDEDIATAVKENPSTPKKVANEIARFFEKDF